jgi:hypothetical protein
MIFPAGVAEMKNFVCKVCTVRSVCHRELEDTKEDETLLRLERMRIIDLTSHWSNGTYKQYKTKYKVIRKFELDYRVSILTPRDMDQPPNDAAIPLMWAQEKYALSIPKWRRNRNSPIENIKFGTVRGIRSAASQYWSWDQLLNDPEK